MSARLNRLGDKNEGFKFRGNLMFASTDHIIRNRPSQLCDLYSLLCVAYAFVHGRLPWIEYISKADKRKCKKDLYERENYVELRIKKREYFD